MKMLTNENISKNQVETIEQYKVLQYLKRELSIYDFKVYLYDKTTIKVIDRDYKSGYFEYNKNTNNIVFSETKKKIPEKEI